MRGKPSYRHTTALGYKSHSLVPSLHPIFSPAHSIKYITPLNYYMCEKERWGVETAWKQGYKSHSTRSMPHILCYRLLARTEVMIIGSDSETLVHKAGSYG